MILVLQSPNLRDSPPLGLYSRASRRNIILFRLLDFRLNVLAEKFRLEVRLH
jgi:hypothetical protein